MKALVTELVQDVLETDMEYALCAAKSERCEHRLGYRSCYYRRRLIRRIGELELRGTQDRQGRFSTEVFARYQRSEKALLYTLEEMYIQGVSTRKIKALEELCGHQFSAGAISGMVAKLDQQLKEFAKRRLDDAFSHLILVALRESPRWRSDTQPGGSHCNRY